MNIKSLQIGDKTLTFNSYISKCDYSNKVTLPNDFTQQTRTEGTFFIATVVATEDCYLRFRGMQTNSENQLYVYDVDSDVNIISIHLDTNHLNQNYYMQPVFISKGKTIEFRVNGFINAAIHKFGVL